MSLVLTVCSIDNAMAANMLPGVFEAVAVEYDARAAVSPYGETVYKLFIINVSPDNADVQSIQVSAAQVVLKAGNQCKVSACAVANAEVSLPPCPRLSCRKAIADNHFALQSISQQSHHTRAGPVRA